MIVPTPRLPRSARSAGFTVPELLLASVLGAMLLMSLAVTTYGYTRNLDHMEEQAGIAGKDPDAALRRMTRDVREAWWVEQVSATHIKIADTKGEFTEYYTQDSDLLIKRPNGDFGVLYAGFQEISMEASFVDRFREGAPVTSDGAWYSTLAATGTEGPLVIGSDESLAIAFTAPAVPEDLPGGTASSEQLKSVQSSVFDLPIAFQGGMGEKKVILTIYEGWAPGRGRPTGTALASTTINGAGIPLAIETGGVWAVPATVLPVSLSATLEPGVGYTLVVSLQGGGNTLVFKQLSQATFPADQVLKQNSAGGGSWVQQLAVVPFEVKGPWVATTTTVTPVINRVSVTIIPVKRPEQQRSAVVLSQGITDNPWLGVVPGEVAP